MYSHNKSVLNWCNILNELFNFIIIFDIFVILMPMVLSLSGNKFNGNSNIAECSSNYISFVLGFR